MNPHLFLFFVAAVSSAALEPGRNDPEFKAALDWAARMGQATATPISFRYASRKSAELLPTWTQTTESHPLSPLKIEYRVRWTDPGSGLVVALEAVVFKDFPAVEWVVRFKNAGTADTPILEEYLFSGRFLSGNRSRPTVLHYAKGALCSIDDFAPVRRAAQTRGHRVCIWSRAAGDPPAKCSPSSISIWATRGSFSASAGPASGPRPSAATRKSLHVRAGMAKTHL